MADTKVDMVAVARSTQLGDALGSVSGTLAIAAPAKVNLLLDIQSKGEDGFHALTSVFQALALHDTVYLRVLYGDEAKDAVAKAQAGTENYGVCGRNGNVVVRTATVFREGIPAFQLAAQDNITFKAVRAFAESYAIDEEVVLEVCVEKHIPAQAGLAGGSSDAAATLVGLARLFGHESPEDKERLEELAAGLGSDVAFFLRGACGVYDQRGQHFVQGLKSRNGFVVIVKPEQGVSTARAYAAFDELDAQGLIEHSAQTDYQSGQEVTLFNNMMAASERELPLLSEVHAWLSAQPQVKQVLLSGSGSAFFAEVATFEDGMHLAAAAGSQGLWARSTMYTPLRAAILPN